MTSSHSRRSSLSLLRDFLDTVVSLDTLQLSLVALDSSVDISCPSWVRTTTVIKVYTRLNDVCSKDGNSSHCSLP